MGNDEEVVRLHSSVQVAEDVIRLFVETVLQQPLIRRRQNFTSEWRLQDFVEATIRSTTSFECHREFLLSPEDIIDLYIPALALGIELKLTSRVLPTLRQLVRYAQHDSIQHLVLICPRFQATERILNHKPLHVIELWKTRL